MKKICFLLLLIISLSECSVDDDLPVTEAEKPNYRNFVTKSLEYEVIFDPLWWHELSFDHSDYRVFNDQTSYLNYVHSLGLLNTSSVTALTGLPIDFNRETLIFLYDISRYTGPCPDRFWIVEALEHRNEIEITLGRDISDCGFFATEKPLIIIKTDKTLKPVRFVDP
jgi:hypothetical protein